MKKQTIALLFAAALLAGCSGSQSSIGLVDVSRLTSNWPKFINYQNQLTADENAIASSHASQGQKTAQARDLAQRYSQRQDELAQEIRDAANKIAAQRNLKLIVTREYVGYGGVDITDDVEKILGITEKATPTP